LVWHIREGRYSAVVLDGLNVLGLGAFTGNIWSGTVKTALGIFFDQRADQAQRRALQAIFTGRAGGWPAQFAELVGDVRGVEFAPIEFDVVGDPGWWTARIPGKVEARGEALAGPTTLPGQRVQVHNPPGAEIGPRPPPGSATPDGAGSGACWPPWPGCPPWPGSPPGGCRCPACAPGSSPPTTRAAWAAPR